MTVDRTLRCGLVATLVLFAACGDDSTSNDAGMDSAVADSGTTDSAMTDSAIADTGTVDTGTPDAGPSCTTGCAIVELALGASHSCARRENGEVLCWGYNDNRELGDGLIRHSNCANAGEREADCSATPVTAAVSDVAEIASSGGHSVCARQTDGTVSCWGRSGQSASAGGPVPPRLDPVIEPVWSGAAQLSDAQRHTCAILADGTVSCVWKNDGGQLGDGTTIERAMPVSVMSLTGALELRVSTFPGSFTCARTASDVQCWGANVSGQLGDGSSSHELCSSGTSSIDCSTTPVTVAGLTDATQITAGTEHACAVKADHTAVCWGSNAAGQLGLDLTTSFSNTPMAVPGLTGVQQIVAGANHTCVLLDDGSVKCFGFNEQGELGDGTLDHGVTCDVGFGSGDCTPTAVDVGLTESATLIAAGRRHTCALLTSGAVACWGLNSRMQLGRADRQPSSTPLIIAGLD